MMLVNVGGLPVTWIDCLSIGLTDGLPALGVVDLDTVITSAALFCSGVDGGVGCGGCTITCCDTGAVVSFISVTLAAHIITKAYKQA